jgi:hypothetical protein
MQVLYDRCAAVDVGKDVIAVAVRLPGDGPDGRQTMKRTFKTFYGVLAEAARWLVSLGAAHVAMEATGIYSMPVYHALLEHGDFEKVVVCNAAHVKNVPGRKTDPLTELPEELSLVGGRTGGFPGGYGRAPRSQVEMRRRTCHGWRCRWAGRLKRRGIRSRPYRLVDADGVLVVPAAAYFRELAACGRSAATHRSFGMAMLRWWRFLRAVEVGRDQVTRAEARDFCSWIQLADKPLRSHWRYPGGWRAGVMTARTVAGTPNPVTGKLSPGRDYATAMVPHCERARHPSSDQLSRPPAGARSSRAQGPGGTSARLPTATRHRVCRMATR